MKMYSKPQTGTIPVQMDVTICSTSQVGFGNEPATSGDALAPERKINVPNF